MGLPTSPHMCSCHSPHGCTPHTRQTPSPLSGLPKFPSFNRTPIMQLHLMAFELLRRRREENEKEELSFYLSNSYFSIVSFSCSMTVVLFCTFMRILVTGFACLFCNFFSLIPPNCFFVCFGQLMILQYYHVLPGSGERPWSVTMQVSREAHSK